MNHLFHIQIVCIVNDDDLSHFKRNGRKNIYYIEKKKRFYKFNSPYIRYDEG